MVLGRDFPVDDNGDVHCPIFHTEWVYEEGSVVVGGVEKRTSRSRKCGEEVHLVVELGLQLAQGMTIAVRAIGQEANTSRWSVECLAGHVLAVSDGEESAEDFEWSAVFP